MRLNNNSLFQEQILKKKKATDYLFHYQKTLPLQFIQYQRSALLPLSTQYYCRILTFIVSNSQPFLHDLNLYSKWIVILILFFLNKSQRILMMNEEMVGSGPDLNTLQLCDLYQNIYPLW